MRTSSAIGARSIATTLLALTAVGLAACGEAAPNPSSDDSSTRSDGRDGSAEPDSPPGEELSRPPDVRVRYGSASVDLSAWTSCYGSTCFDGVPPRNPPDVGSPPEVVVEFPLEDWTFKATFQAPSQDYCARTFPTKLEEVGPGRFLLRPAGYAGEYDVTLSGRGPEGDAFVTFRWTTPSDGPLPTPSSYASIIADNDGRIGSYGVEMNVSQLAAEPDRVDARITVTAADGDFLTFTPRLTHDCPANGSLSWDGPNSKGREAADLGPAPFTYDVRLGLDGQTYRAHATWPDDVIRGYSPYVRLDFTPDLPALR